MQVYSCILGFETIWMMFILFLLLEVFWMLSNILVYRSRYIRSREVDIVVPIHKCKGARGLIKEIITDVVIPRLQEIIADPF